MMGCPLGLLMASVFMFHLEKEFPRDSVLPSQYKRYVNDTLARMPKTDAAALTWNSDYIEWSTPEPVVYNETSC